MFDAWDLFFFSIALFDKLDVINVYSMELFFLCKLNLSIQACKDSFLGLQWTIYLYL